MLKASHAGNTGKELIRATIDLKDIWISQTPDEQFTRHAVKFRAASYEHTFRFENDSPVGGNAYVPEDGKDGCGGSQQCDADGGYFCCGDPACNLVRGCASNAGLQHCACPLTETSDANNEIVFLDDIKFGFPDVGFAERTCATCSACNSAEYEVQPCNAERDTICAPLTECRVTLTEATATSDRVCKPCFQCPASLTTLSHPSCREPARGP